MHIVNHVEKIARSSARIAELITTENYEIKVPSCPEWTLLDLVTHIGQVQEFWSHCIREGNIHAHWQGEVKGADSHHDAAEHLRYQTKLLIDAIQITPATAPCWTWWEKPQTVSAVARHQVQEAEIHRWDAELTVAEPSPIPLEIAVDSISEFLQVRRSTIEKLKLPHIQLKASEVNSEWHLGDSATGNTRMVGLASDLILFLTGRCPIEKFEVSGDSDALKRFFDALPEINN